MVATLECIDLRNQDKNVGAKTNSYVKGPCLRFKMDAQLHPTPVGTASTWVLS